MPMDGIHGKGMRRAEVGCVYALPLNRPLWTKRVLCGSRRAGGLESQAFTGTPWGLLAARVAQVCRILFILDTLLVM